MNHTLIAFQWHPNDKRAGGPYPIERALTDNPGVEIAEGVYLYKSVQDCGKIHRLCAVLQSQNRPFALLRFEAETSELCCFSESESQTQLTNALGFSVGNFREPKKF